MRRAQASIEAIIIIAGVLVVMLVLVGMLMDIGTTSQTAYDEGLVRTATNDLADVATLVWHQGEGARQRIYLSLPDDINNITFNGTRITLGRDMEQRTYGMSLDFNITGNISTPLTGYVIVERTGGRVVVRASS